MTKKLEQLEFPGGWSRMNPDGSEVPDSRPMALPVGFERPESIQDLIRRLVTDRLIREDLERQDAESFEDADDFNVDDDTFDPKSPYEEQFDPAGLIAREQEIRSGTVASPSAEQIANAKELLAHARDLKRRAKEKLEAPAPPLVDHQPAKGE